MQESEEMTTWRASWSRSTLRMRRASRCVSLKVYAVAGRGLKGDWYHEGKGFYSYHGESEREVTFIGEETIEALRRDPNLKLAPGETRRNVVPRGTPLNHLVGREFRMDEAVLRDVDLCELCEHLVNVTGKRSLFPNLIHRGGLHAQALMSVEIPMGDEIEAVR